MSSIAADDHPPQPVAAGWRRRAGLLVLVIAADWLLYGHALGLSVVLFLLALTATALAMGPVRAPARDLAIAGVVFVAATAPLVYATTISAVALAALAAAHLVLAMFGLGGVALVDRLGRAAAILLDGCGRIVVDLFDRPEAEAPAERRSLRFGRLTGWIVPIVFGVVFLLLFRAANPLVDAWLAAIAPDRWFGTLAPQRVLFWIGVAVMVWPFVRITQPLAGRLLGRAAWSMAVDLRAMVAQAAWSETMFGDAAIRRSLILFNLMFAVQTVLDLAYLWGGLDLPEGMSYAAYAHRGAYPLVATALLAAVFVLVAMRPGGATSRSPLIRALVFVWVGQNVLLVVSSMLRLDLYVAVYSLTYLRVAALVWMLLVAAGLILIVLRIALHRSNRWLVSMNTLALLLTLYACGFVNMPAVIATYNVDHSRELTGEGVWLDLVYLMDLGPQAIPALDRFIAANPDFTVAAEIRADFAQAHEDAMADWRGWTLRRADLAAYLAGSAPGAGAWDGLPASD